MQYYMADIDVTSDCHVWTSILLKSELFRVWFVRRQVCARRLRYAGAERRCWGEYRVRAFADMVGVRCRGITRALCVRCLSYDVIRPSLSNIAAAAVTALRLQFKCTHERIYRAPRHAFFAVIERKHAFVPRTRCV